MRMSRFAALLLTMLAALLLAAGCGDDDGGDRGDGGDAGNGKGESGSEIETPAPLEADGQFVVCTDVPYPPAEFLEGDKFVGYEIDLMNEVADRLGTEAEYEKTLFDAIIPALKARKCDAIISSMNVTPEREQEVAFVEYMEIGQSIMVPAGEAEGIKTLEDLAGKSVAVQVGTTLKDRIDAVSKDLDEPIDVQTFPDAGAAANALKTDKVDAFFADSPVVAEYIVKDEEAFEFAGEPVDPLPVGIALRKEDRELQDAVQEAIDGMYEDGTMEEILAEWNVEDFMLDRDGSDGEAEDGDGEDA